MDNIKWSESSSVLTAIEQTLLQKKYNGISWTWKSLSDYSESDTKKNVYFAWQFEWDELIKQGIEGFEGTITVNYSEHPNSNPFSTIPAVEGFPKIFSLNLTRSGQWVEKSLGSEDVVGLLFTRNDVYFTCDFDMKPIKNNDESYLFEKTFAASDKTDVILIIEGKRMHVNKQFLSFHSEYFDVLFNSEFKEKTMDEIPIEAVDYDDFARLLSVVYPNPIIPTFSTSTSLQELADRFMMREVSRLVQSFSIRYEHMKQMEKRYLADNNYPPETMKMASECHQILDERFQRVEAFLTACDKAEAITNFHPEYFNTLFNSEFKEKSIDAIPIEAVNYQDFAHILSVISPNPTLPTDETSMYLLELADLFEMPMVTRLVEFFLIHDETIPLRSKLVVADKYSLEELMKECLNSIKTAADLRKIMDTPHFQGLILSTQVKILAKVLEFQ